MQSQVMAPSLHPIAAEVYEGIRKERADFGPLDESCFRRLNKLDLHLQLEILERARTSTPITKSSSALVHYLISRESNLENKNLKRPRENESCKIPKLEEKKKKPSISEASVSSNNPLLMTSIPPTPPKTYALNKFGTAQNPIDLSLDFADSPSHFGKRPEGSNFEKNELKNNFGEPPKGSNFGKNELKIFGEPPESSNFKKNELKKIGKAPESSNFVKVEMKNFGKAPESSNLVKNEVNVQNLRREELSFGPLKRMMVKRSSKMTEQMKIWGKMGTSRRYLLDFICGGSDGVNRLDVQQIFKLTENFSPSLKDVVLSLRKFHGTISFSTPDYEGSLVGTLENEKRETILKANVDLKGEITQIGVADEEGSCVAYRVLGWDRWLKLTIPDKAGEQFVKPLETITSLTIEVGLRKFVYFAHKDPEKGNDEAKCFFFALNSQAENDILNPNFVQYKTADEARMQLAHFQTCGTIQKMAKRLCLPFSSTHPLGVKITEDMVAVVNDIECKDEFGNITIATDGSGFILEDMVPKISVDNGKIYKDLEVVSKPTVLQVRGYSGGTVWKGTLLNVKKFGCFVDSGKCFVSNSVRVERKCKNCDPRFDVKSEKIIFMFSNGPPIIGDLQNKSRR